MSFRTTSIAVQDLLARNYDGKTPVTAFMKSANTLVNRLVNAAAAKGVAYSAMLDSDTLERIECHLGCHFYQRHDPGFQSKTTGKSAATFQGQTGMGLEGTMYGQDAMTLDPTGCLAAINKGGRNIGITWIGKPKSAQIPYDQRD